MIHGDIDLTENLDFYHDKSNIQKSFPIVPWKSEVGKSLDFYDTLTFNIQDLNTYTIQYNSSTQNNLYINTNNFTYTSWTSLYDDSTTWTSTSYYSNLIDEYMWNNYKSIKSKKKVGYFKQKPKVTQRSIVFKNKPTNNGISIKEFIDKSTKPNYENSCFDYLNNIPWKDKYHDNNRTYKSKYNRNRNKVNIPWLSKLPSRIYNDYIKDLYEEQDYDKYLTDMGWLGIH